MDHLFANEQFEPSPVDGGEEEQVEGEEKRAGHQRDAQSGVIRQENTQTPRHLFRRHHIRRPV